MKHQQRNLIFYVSTILVFIMVLYMIISMGKHLEEGRQIVRTTADTSSWVQFTESIHHNFIHPLATLLVQILVIIFAARAFGWMSSKIGQPAVIGEIIAGIVLGPSLVGMYFPDIFNAIFPAQSLPNLSILSQIGLILFMFVVGMELDLSILKNKAQDAVVISHASIILPFALGFALAYFIYPQFAPQNIEFVSFALFLGIAMSITAFPVLARIIQERKMHKTRLGSIIITCAAADDITAWTILAAVIAIVKAGSAESALFTMLLSLLYVLTMIYLVRPFLKRVGDIHSSRENLNKPIVALFFFVLLLSAFATEVIGIHALFGAFMAGAIMPQNEKFRNVFIEKVEDIALVLLLPLFFVFTGLRTQIGLLNDVNLWLITLGIILVATIGKFVGSAIAARYVGQTWRESLIIGALMNTRGLMELVVLNIGYDLGVLGPEIFAMMVIMALVTTFTTAPAIELINWIYKHKPENESETATPVIVGKLRRLISFGHPQSGKKLYRIAHLLKSEPGQNDVTAMHLSISNNVHAFKEDAFMSESFQPIMQEAALSNDLLETVYKPTRDLDADIALEANSGKYEILLIGLGSSIFEGSILGRLLGLPGKMMHPSLLLNSVKQIDRIFDESPFNQRTQHLLSLTHIPVGILVDKNFETANHVLVLIIHPNDEKIRHFTKRMALHGNNTVVEQDLRNLPSNELHSKNLSLAEVVNQTLDSFNWEKFDLVVMSLESWKAAIDNQDTWLEKAPSVLLFGNLDKLP